MEQALNIELFMSKNNMVVKYVLDHHGGTVTPSPAAPPHNLHKTAQADARNLYSCRTHGFYAYLLHEKTIRYSNRYLNFIVSL